MDWSSDEARGAMGSGGVRGGVGDRDDEEEVAPFASMSPLAWCWDVCTSIVMPHVEAGGGKSGVGMDPFTGCF